jgi:acetyl esterase/lipase
MSPISIENIVYGSVLGAGLVADIAFPPTLTSMPAAISIHGGRWIRGTRKDDGREGRANNGVIDLLQWASAGFFAMRIDYRLVTCTPAPACYQDVMCALRWVHSHASEYHIDADKIFLIGQSAGGHLAALAATLGYGEYEKTGGWETARSDFAAAICIAGAYDLQTLDWGSGWCPPGVRWDVARRYASPIEHVSRESTPLLFFHAEDDSSVPVSQADLFSQRLAEFGTRHVYHRYSSGGHLRITDTVYDACQLFIREITTGAK